MWPNGKKFKTSKMVSSNSFKIRQRNATNLSPPNSSSPPSLPDDPPESTMEELEKKASLEQLQKQQQRAEKKIPKNHYLGQKGYTVLKQELDDATIEKIKKDLMARPQCPGAAVQPKPFPVYRESQNKLYLPRYYGEGLFGIPKNRPPEISPGIDIDCPFAGELRPYQVPLCSAYIDHVAAGKEAGSIGANGLIQAGCAAGKTVCALYIIAALKKKTLVIVHKEFLLTQWIERMGQFLPTAKIGRIQGQTVDVEGKDVVIGMLQSLSMKDYPADLFAQFGLTIIDETHHMGSEVFSRTLFKIVTANMLGLSATMERKDGLTKIFKMFLGEIIYTKLDKSDDPVVVYAVDYRVSGDSEYEKVITDFRGNTMFSSMVTKLCDYIDRSEFIIRLVRDMVKIYPGQQMLILGQNRSLLKYLYEAIEGRGIASVGYYVGGMKASARKESEGKDILLGTYNMASEGLDIKTLASLILATPRVDIEQTVGRILREKHKHPMVVDIVDMHDTFQRQWLKRRRFFRGEKYTVLRTNSDVYSGLTGGEDGWRVEVRGNGVVRGCSVAGDEEDSCDDSVDECFEEINVEVVDDGNEVVGDSTKKKFKKETKKKSSVEGCLVEFDW